MLLPEILTITPAASLADIDRARAEVDNLDAGFEISPEMRDAALDHLDAVESTIRLRNATI